MMRITEIIFSPTHSSEKAAERIAETIAAAAEEKIIDLCAVRAMDTISVDADAAVIAVPSYGGRVPKTAADRLKTIRADHDIPAVLAVTYGNRDFEDTLIELSDLASECGFLVIGACALSVQHNIMPVYGEGRPDEHDIRELRDFAEKASEKLRRGDVSLPFIPGNRPYKEWHGSSMPIEYHAELCSGCMLCEEKCPAGAISKRGSVTDTDLCIGCMRCVHDCPAHARRIPEQLQTMMTEKMREACTARKENFFSI